MVSSSTLANISHQSTFPGENRGVSLDFLTRVSFRGGTGEFSHQSILSGGNGGISLDSLTRVSFRRRTGQFLRILSSEYLFGGARGKI